MQKAAVASHCGFVIFRMFFDYQICRDLGLKIIMDHLKTLKSNSKPVFETDEIKTLHDARLLRNLFIHNAGIICEKYTQQAARPDLKANIGKQYVLDDSELHNYLTTIKIAAGKLELCSDEAQNHIMIEVLREIERTGKLPDFNE
jgi:hypothetical protein